MLQGFHINITRICQLHKIKKEIEKKYEHLNIMSL